jgi:hypothetical protein
MTRYTFTVRGELGARLASSIGDVEVEAAGGQSIVTASIAAPADLDALVGRLGDLGLEIISLGQEEHALSHPRGG